MLINKFKVSENQYLTANNIFEKFCSENNTSNIILPAETQEGKTGTAIAAAYRYHTAFPNKKILYLLNYSNNDASDDIQNDLAEAFDYDKSKNTNKIEFFKLGSGDRGYTNLIKILEKEENKEKVGMIIIDEGHRALGDERQFHTVMKLLGINYANDCSTWENQKIKVLTITATGFPHLNKNAANKYLAIPPSFTVVKMIKSEQYMSPEKIYNKGRFLNNFSYIENDTITEEFKKSLDNFNDYCKKNGNKHCLIRMSPGENNLNELNTICNYINTSYPNYKIRIFHTEPQKFIDNLDLYICTHSLDKLNNILSSEPNDLGDCLDSFDDPNPCPNIIIIYYALSMSTRLNNVCHIGAWIEPKRKGKKSRNTDTIIQSIGRNCGYSLDRHEANFPIYCELDQVENYIELNKNEDILDKIDATWLTDSSDRKTITWSEKPFAVCDTEAEAKASIESFCEMYEWTDEGKNEKSPTFVNFKQRPKTPKPSTKEIKNMFKKVWPGIRQCSKNSEDVAGEIARKTTPGGGFQQKRAYSLFVVRYMDGPSTEYAKYSKEHLENSWNEYCKQYGKDPKYIIFIALDEKKKNPNDRTKGIFKD